MIPSQIGQKVLLVEGKDDCHVVGHILEKANVQVLSCSDIKDKEGVDKLLRAVFGEVKAPDREVVGIVLDANDEPEARWRSISGRLRDACVALPEKPVPSGAIVRGTPRVGVWLMPDNQSPGQLEDFVSKMIPGDDPAWSLAQKYIANIPPDHRRFTSAKTSRAELHAWLASRKQPGHMGVAVARGDLSIEGALCQQFLTWITALFD